MSLVLLLLLLLLENNGSIINNFSFITNLLLLHMMLFMWCHYLPGYAFCHYNYFAAIFKFKVEAAILNHTNS